MEPNIITAIETQQKIQSDECFIIDVREPDEFNSEHIQGAINLPLSSLTSDSLKHFHSQGLCVIQCKTGSRAKQAFEELKSSNSDLSLCILEGGISAWKSADLNVMTSALQPLPVMRLVQIIAGSLVFISVILGLTVHQGFFAIALFVSAGLVFAGVTGWCGMAVLIRRLLS